MLMTLFSFGSCAFAANPEDSRAAAGRSVALMQKVNSQWKTHCSMEFLWTRNSLMPQICGLISRS